MEKRDLKLHFFEYIIGELAKRYSSYNLPQFNESNDFSKLKVMKLLFFVVAIDAKRNSLIDEYFTEFHAMPYGPVELDIYESIQTGQSVNRFHIDKTRAQCLSLSWEEFDFSFKDIRNDYKAEFLSIDTAVDKLMTVNADIINYRAFDLVEISHLWNSWRISYDIARSNARYQQRMYSEIIREENHIFSLA